MIPYFTFTTISLGPIHLYVWGLMVALGVFVALCVAYQRAKRDNLDGARLVDFVVWTMAAAFIGARLFHVIFYDWPHFSAYPLDTIKIWKGGLSSFGGFIGAAIAAVIYAKIKRIIFWDYANVIMYAFPLGLGIGRLGCFFNHLHIGRLSSSPLAVAFPGGSRLDMGLFESMFGFLLFAIYFLFLRKIQKKIFLPLTMLIYGIVRFILDFGRATDIANADVRYAGLTPAQYGSLLLVMGATYLFFRINFMERRANN